MYSQISARIIQYWNHGNTMMVYENDCLNKAKLLPKSSPNGNGKIKALGLMTFAAVDVNIPVQYLHFVIVTIFIVNVLQELTSNICGKALWTFLDFALFYHKV